MSAFDLPLDQLRAFHPPRSEPADFDAFWQETLASARAAAREPSFERTSTPLRTVSVDDVTFSGFGGQPIKGWFLAPAGATGPLATIVNFLGYGGAARCRSNGSHGLPRATDPAVGVLTTEQGLDLRPGCDWILVGRVEERFGVPVSAVPVHEDVGRLIEVRGLHRANRHRGSTVGHGVESCRHGIGGPAIDAG